MLLEQISIEKEDIIKIGQRYSALLPFRRHYPKKKSPILYLKCDNPDYRKCVANSIRRSKKEALVPPACILFFSLFPYNMFPHSLDSFFVRLLSQLELISFLDSQLSVTWDSFNFGKIPLFVT